MIVKNWQPEKLKAEIRKNLTSNGEAVGKFVETEARRRLHAITEPEWGKGYRQQIVSRLLGYEVAQMPNEVVIRMGVRTTADSRHHGFYIELGSSTAPAQPFLRPAVFQNGSKIVGLLEG